MLFKNSHEKTLPNLPHLVWVFDIQLDFIERGLIQIVQESGDIRFIVFPNCDRFCIFLGFGNPKPLTVKLCHGH